MRGRPDGEALRRILRGMAIVRMQDTGQGGGLERRVGLKVTAKNLTHAGKKAATKHAGKKAAAKKHAAKHAGEKAAKHAAKKAAGSSALVTQGGGGAAEHALRLARAYHHLQRAGAVISLLEHDSGGDLRMLLDSGIELYRRATGAKQKTETVLCAQGLLRAAEHLGMAGLYSARAQFRMDAPVPSRGEVAEHLRGLEPRLRRLPEQERENGRRLEAMARELLRRAAGAGDDPHLEYELTMAAEGICTALEAGL